MTYSKPQDAEKSKTEQLFYSILYRNRPIKYRSRFHLVLFSSTLVVLKTLSCPRSHFYLFFFSFHWRVCVFSVFPRVAGRQLGPAPGYGTISGTADPQCRQSLVDRTWILSVCRMLSLLGVLILFIFFFILFIFLLTIVCVAPKQVRSLSLAQCALYIVLSKPEFSVS